MFLLEEIQLPPIESCHSESAHHHFHDCQHKSCRKWRWSMEMQPWTKFVQLFQKATMMESTQELLMLNPKSRVNFKYLSKFVRPLTCGFNPETPWKGANLLWSQTSWRVWASVSGSEFCVYCLSLTCPNGTISFQTPLPKKRGPFFLGGAIFFCTYTLNLS